MAEPSAGGFFGEGDESLTGIAEAVAAAVQEEELPRMWKVQTRDGKVYKAAPEEKLIGLLRAGKLPKDVKVCREGDSEWYSITEVPSLAQNL